MEHEVFNANDLEVIKSFCGNRIDIKTDLDIVSIFAFLITNNTHGYMYKQNDQWFISNKNSAKEDRILVFYNKEWFEIGPCINNKVYISYIKDTNEAIQKLKMFMEDWDIRNDIIWTT